MLNESIDKREHQTAFPKGIMSSSTLKCSFIKHQNTVAKAFNRPALVSALASRCYARLRYPCTQAVAGHIGQGITMLDTDINQAACSTILATVLEDRPSEV